MLQSTKMATKTNQSCPICKDTRDDFCCHHQVCLSCILQWTHRNPVCSLCRTISVLFSDQGEGDSLETSITVPEDLPATSSQEGRAPDSLDETSSHSPVVSRPSSPQDTPFHAVGSVWPEVWAELFRQQQPVLDPVWTWLRRRLEIMYGDQWWMIESTESCIMHFLCTYGPDEELMIQSLQDILEEHTVPLVRDIIDIIVSHCSEGAQRLLRSRAARDEDDSPTASSSSSSSSSSSRSSSSSSRMDFPNSPTVSVEEEEAGTTEAALCKGHSCSPPVPVPTEQDQTQEGLGQEVVAVAGPSVQGSSHSPSTP